MLQKDKIPSGLIGIYVGREHGRASIGEFKETRGIIGNLTDHTAVVSSEDADILFYCVPDSVVLEHLIFAGQVAPGVVVLLPGQKFIYSYEKLNPKQAIQMPQVVLNWILGV